MEGDVKEEDVKEALEEDGMEVEAEGANVPKMLEIVCVS